jgi:Protein of unknown function (DUF3500)
MKTRTPRLVLLAACSATFMAGVWLQPAVSSQAPEIETHAQRAERFRRMSADFEKTGLAAPFKGITANGHVEPGVFAIRSTGVSTERVRKAAEVLLASLSKAERDKSTFGVDDDEWRKWMNQDFYVRQGVSFLEMTEAQREAGLGRLRAGLSAKGLKQTGDIMRLNHTLGEMDHDDFDRYGEWRYHVTVSAQPAAHPRRRPYAERQRLREGSAAAALPAASAQDRGGASRRVDI